MSWYLCGYLACVWLGNCLRTSFSIICPWKSIQNQQNLKNRKLWIVEDVQITTWKSGEIFLHLTNYLRTKGLQKIDIAKHETEEMVSIHSWKRCYWKSHCWKSTTENPLLKIRHWKSTTENSPLKIHRWKSATENLPLKIHHWKSTTGNETLLVSRWYVCHWNVQSNVH